MSIDLTGLVRPHLVEMTKREDNPNVAEFRLQPLERGFGHTLGTATPVDRSEAPPIPPRGIPARHPTRRPTPPGPDSWA